MEMRRKVEINRVLSDKSVSSLFLVPLLLFVQSAVAMETCSSCFFFKPSPSNSVEHKKEIHLATKKLEIRSHHVTSLHKNQLLERRTKRSRQSMILSFLPVLPSVSSPNEAPLIKQLKSRRNESTRIKLPLLLKKQIFF
jgi:hypothetical protein